MNFSAIKIRDYALDNLRFFLIFSVVFAHLLEVCTPFKGDWLIYLFIYTFHMPAFIFLFGYNVKYSLRRIVYHWCIPYVVFQSIYILFSRFILKNDESLQYTTPYWLLWYMVVCIFYQLLLPFFDAVSKRRQLLILTSVLCISLLVGFCDSVGYYLSLSRFFVFQPWFLLGYYCKKNGTISSISGKNKVRFFLVFVSVCTIALSIPFLYFVSVPRGLLYGSYSFSNCGSTLWMRIVVFLFSFCWIVLLFFGFKPFLNKHINLITRIGQNTLPIFLLHGFFVRAVPVYWPNLLSSPLRVILITCIILLLLGNELTKKLIIYLSFMWLGDKKQTP